ncbi:MAG: NAD-dependent epimerase/dehydratase family protein [Candidatus Uhrbacteria bacterium]
MSKTAVVTGGAGFIGSHLVDRLIEEGWEVTVIDNLVTGFRTNVNPRAVFKKLDICKPEASALIRAVKPQVVFHLAAQASVPESVKNPIKDAETNIHATLRLLDAAAEARVKWFVMATTGGALSSEKTKLPTDEEHAPEPTSPYAIAKVACERYGAFYRLARKLPFVALRFANVYGPRQNPHGEAGVVAIFSKRMLANESLRINGDGKQTRDYVFVSDVVDALVAVLAVPKAEGPFHVGTGIEVSVNDIYKQLAKMIGYTKKPLKGPSDIGAPRRSVLDASKIRRELDWVPATSFEEGLRLTVDWFRNS